MKNMTDKTKKRLVIASGLVISAVLAIFIAGAFKTPHSNDVDVPNSSSETPSVVAENPDTTENGNNIKVPDIEISKDTESPNGIDKGIDQTIQSNASKKPIYTEDELTNPEQKPNGEKVDKPTEENPTPPQTQDKPTEKPNKPAGGLPGFDNVPNAGENETIIDDGMYENGNKVGVMG